MMNKGIKTRLIIHEILCEIKKNNINFDSQTIQNKINIFSEKDSEYFCSFNDNKSSFRTCLKKLPINEIRNIICDDEIIIAIGGSSSGRAHARTGDRYQDMKEMGIKNPK